MKLQRNVRLSCQRARPGLFRAAALLLAGLLAGCASTPKSYQIQGEADPVVNRDASGAPLSVVVRLYQLKAPAEFSKLTFDTLASGRSENELLGTDLLEKTEVVLVPGATHTRSETLREDTRYLGVVAFFRRPHPHYWRYLVEADAVRRDGLAFRARDCYLSLIRPKPAPIPGQPANAPLDCEPVVAAAGAQAQPEAGAEPGKVEAPAQTKSGKPARSRPKVPKPTGAPAPAKSQTAATPQS